MKTTTKIFSSLLSLALVYSLASCNKASSIITPQNIQTNETDSSVSVSSMSESQVSKLLDNEMSAQLDDFDTSGKVSTSSLFWTYVPPANASLENVKQYKLTMKESPNIIKKRFFEPSTLAFDDSGNLYTMPDKGYYTIFKLTKNGKNYDVSENINLSKWQMLKLRFSKSNRFDFEGIEYLNGLFYAIDERDRKVFTIDKSGNLKAVNIDVNAYLKANKLKNDVTNSGLEGMTIDKTKNEIFLLKERQESVIMVADLNTNKIVRHFKINLPGKVEPAITDASFFNGNLYVLVRSHRLILKMNPQDGTILATYDYRKYEEDSKNVYVKIPSIGSGNDPDGYGVMEGLAVNQNSFFVATDNNMLPLKSNLLDNYPRIFEFERPQDDK